MSIVFSSVDNDGKLACVSVMVFNMVCLCVLSIGHSSRKWGLLPTSDLHNWHTLSDSGGLGDL